jgi:hypothetical protein
MKPIIGLIDLGLFGYEVAKRLSNDDLRHMEQTMVLKFCFERSSGPLHDCA